jgi:hypothetical protein
MQLSDRPVLDAFQVLRETGLLGILIAILIGGWKRWWIFGWQHREACQHYEDELAQLRHEREEWKQMAIGTDAPRRSVWDANKRRAAQAAREAGGST